MEKVSIIIPIYNSEKYINKCVDAILCQTFKKIEIILINDGSTDKSLEIIESYAKKYDFIKVIDQKNCGVSATRNKGLEVATGNYVMFIDNDDWIETDYVETFYNTITTTNSDIVIGGYRRINSKNKVLKKTIISNYIDIYNQIAPWGKIYKKSYLNNNNIFFRNYVLGEDIYFNCLAYSKTNKIKTIKYCGYNWFYNENSISNTKHKKITTETRSEERLVGK